MVTLAIGYVYQSQLLTIKVLKAKIIHILNYLVTLAIAYECMEERV